MFPVHCGIIRYESETDHNDIIVSPRCCCWWWLLMTLKLPL